MGVANDHSIAWGIGESASAQGAELAFYLSGRGAGQARETAGAIARVELILPCDVENLASVDQVFETLRAKWADWISVHAIAFSDKNELKGRYATPAARIFSRTC